MALNFISQSVVLLMNNIWIEMTFKLYTRQIFGNFIIKINYTKLLL